MAEEEKNKLVAQLNDLEEDLQEGFWLKNQDGCKYESSIRDGMLEYNWFYFKPYDIWMCKVYDFDQAKEGNGYVRQIVFFKEKVDLKLINSGLSSFET